MNIIEESFNEKKPTTKNKKPLKIILALIILLILGIISTIIAITYIENSTRKLYIDQVRQDNVEKMLVEEGDTTYVPIRDIAQYLGYQSYNGDYTEKSEDRSKCYIEGENEIATFSLNSRKIYKIEKTSGAKYQYYYAKKPVKAINGKLYISTDGMEQAFNVSFVKSQDQNKIDIYTMPMLVNSYETMILDKGYTEISEEFNNRKSIFDNRLIVAKDKKQIGVIDLNGEEKIEPKYESITYLPQTGDYLVQDDKKVGIMTKDGDQKVQIIYDEIELMDKDAGLYKVKRDDKYGVIDLKGKVQLYVEYDEIGIDISSFGQNDIKSEYLLVDNLIPVKKGDLWGLFDKKARQIVDFIYDGFGYIATSNKDAINLLVIPDYNVIVTQKDKKYGLINSSGKEVFKPIADDIYMTINSNVKEYNLNYLDRKFNVTSYLDSIGVKTKQETNDTREEETEENTEQQEEQNNDQQQEQQEEQQEQPQEEQQYIEEQQYQE